MVTSELFSKEYVIEPALGVAEQLSGSDHQRKPVVTLRKSSECATSEIPVFVFGGNGLADDVGRTGPGKEVVVLVGVGRERR